MTSKSHVHNFLAFSHSWLPKGLPLAAQQFRGAYMYGCVAG